MATSTGVKVELSGVHLCCQGCVYAADTAIRSVAGADSHCDMENGTITLTARDDASARKALEALAAAGFYGSSDNPDLAMKPVGTIPAGKVKSATVSGIHNCCDLCCEAIQGAINSVEGVTSATAEPGETEFEVAGHFHPASLVAELNTAGFSARVT